MNSAIIFGLLIALMLTGMPISISLGLTVLTFIFTMTQVPVEQDSAALGISHSRPQPPQSVSVLSWVSQPLAGLVSQLSQPLSQAPRVQVPVEQDSAA